MIHYAFYLAIKLLARCVHVMTFIKLYINNYENKLCESTSIKYTTVPYLVEIHNCTCKIMVTVATKEPS